MNYRLKVLPEAKIDIAEIVEWYNSEQRGLGKRFFDSLKVKLEFVRKNPLHWQIGYRDVRSVLMDKFPYQINFGLMTPQIQSLFLRSPIPAEIRRFGKTSDDCPAKSAKFDFKLRSILK